ncbi:hypothetical protein WR25_26329 [Diploscapter pachys]|uniref:C2H2-type domain-containing protein n=1 Tax=Diploscapter pachys TaxID=2018661 RepID=A0A2A2L6R7_9BILA|nr:hypothetical protein WR25_26329 [Diploscapter pachys]
MNLEDDSSSTESESKSSSVEQEERKSPEICQEAQESAQKDDQQPTTSNAGQEKEQNSDRSKYSDEDLFAFLKNPKLLKAYELPTLTLTNDTKTWKTVNERGVSIPYAGRIFCQKCSTFLMHSNFDEARKANIFNHLINHIHITFKKIRYSCLVCDVCETAEDEMQRHFWNRHRQMAALGDSGYRDESLTWPDELFATVSQLCFGDTRFWLLVAPKSRDFDREREMAKQRIKDSAYFKVLCQHCLVYIIYTAADRKQKILDHVAAHVFKLHNLWRYSCSLCEWGSFHMTDITDHVERQHNQGACLETNFIDCQQYWPEDVVNDVMGQCFGEENVLEQSPDLWTPMMDDTGIDSAYLDKRKKLDRKAKKGKKPKKKAKSSTKKTEEDFVYSPGLVELSELKPMEGGMVNQSIGENLKDVDITVPEPTHASALIAQLNSSSFGIAQRPQVVGKSRKRKNEENPKKKYTFECLKCKETTIYSHSHKYTKMWYHAGRHIKEEFGIPRYTCELCPFATYGKCLIRPHMVGRHGEEEAHKFIDHRPGWSVHLISNFALELYGDRTALFSKSVNNAPLEYVPLAPDTEKELEAAFPTMTEEYSFLDVLEASHQADLEEMESDEDFREI